MNTKGLISLGVPLGEPLALAHEFIQSFIAQGRDGALLEAEIFNIVANPPAFFADELRAAGLCDLSPGVHAVGGIAAPAATQ